ncbi:MAG: O-antigen ligase family protein [Parcubacteria group bacterium]|nr:O-antigen ligase family protein [Parcubacteria group bacterium]
MKRLYTILTVPANLMTAYVLLVVALIATGYIPREVALGMAGVVVFFVIFSPIETGTRFTIRMIPFFIALPISESLDALNLWRITLFILAVKLLLGARSGTGIFPASLREHITLVDAMACVLLLFALLSVLVSPDVSAAVKRILYFGNAVVIFYLVRALVRVGRIQWNHIGNEMVFAGTVVILIGFIQLAMTYFYPIVPFADFWANTVQRGLYGNEWSMRVAQGNTWFAYFYHAIKLRMFSSFTSSHTFGLYTILALPFISVLGYAAVSPRGERPRRASWWGYIGMLAMILLAVILTGTRGIWLSAIFPISLVIMYFYWFPERRYRAKKAMVVMALFVAMAVPASLIYTSPQFRMRGPTDALLLERFNSIIDFGETSNQGRIRIWKASLDSIRARPILGVGIGNFPVVIGEAVERAKEGASAHNAYLQVATEMGVPAGLAFLLFLAGTLHAAWLWQRSVVEREACMGLGLLLALTWVFGYSLTDASLFDERVLLGFLAVVGCIQGFAERNNPSQVLAIRFR